MSTCFIADLHLSAEEPETVERFIRFLNEEAGEHKTLYILGDLFELWLGDTLPSSGSEPVLEALRTVTDGGTDIYVQHGNRDFLLGSGFEKQSGCKLIADPYLIGLDGRRILLTHGDQLCTGDLSYQKYRKLIRNPLVRWTLLHLPSTVRVAIGDKLRRRSNYDKGNKTSAIMDVTEDKVRETMREWNTRLLIHGHTHRPALHNFELDGKSAERMVLGDWESADNTIIYRDGSFRQLTL